jgi:hypothetical protein
MHGRNARRFALARYAFRKPIALNIASALKLFRGDIYAAVAARFWCAHLLVSFVFVHLEVNLRSASHKARNIFNFIL